MAINDNTTAAQNNNAQAAAAIPQAAPQVQTTQAAVPQSPWASMGILGRLPIERNPGSEVLSSLQSKFKKLIEETANNEDWIVGLVPIDNVGDSGLKFSTLVLTLISKKQPRFVAYHSLMLEGSSDKIPSRFENVNGVQVEIFHPSTDAYDADFSRIVQSRLAFGPEMVKFNADTTMVPRNFDVSDELKVRVLLSNTMFACHNELTVRNPEFVDVTIGLLGPNTVLRVVHNFEKVQINDATAQPVRSDLMLNFTFQQQQQTQQNASVNSTQQARTVSRLSGFIDLAYDPAVPQQNAYMNPQMAGMNPFLTYAARLVVTNLDLAVASTLPTQLLALSSALTLSENNSWYHTFFQHGGSKVNGVDLNDIGAIGYEVNIFPQQGAVKKAYDTKSSAFTHANLGHLLGMTCRPNLMLAMDVPDCGPQTWYTAVFAAAAQGNAEAIQAILNAAHVLTNGKFDKDNFHGPIFSGKDRILLGSYTADNGARHDIRDVDYLAILNATQGKDMDLLTTWSNSFSGHLPLPKRLADRKAIIMNLFPNAEINGAALRLTFSGEFCARLAQAQAAAGMRLSVQTPMSGAEFNNQRGTFNSSSALIPLGAAAQFTQQYSNPGAGVNAGGSYNGRW